jgi:lipoyl-dependent peroxiredoxin
MIAAAHAGCFGVALSFRLAAAGYPPEELAAEASIGMSRKGVDWSITRVDLRLEARVPGIPEDTFQVVARGALETCPISRALAVDISLEARLGR